MAYKKSFSRFGFVFALAFMILSPQSWAAGTTSDPSPSELYKAAQSQIDKGAYRDALPLLEKVLQQKGDDADAYNLLGFSYRHLGDRQKALEYYGKALQLEPGHLGANEYLGELYLEMNNPTGAEERLAILQKACGTCEEQEDLQTKLASYKAAHP